MTQPAVFVQRFKVRHYECDAYGHLNNAVYLRYMQEAGIEAAASVGFGREWHATMNRVWVPRRIEVEYLQPIELGESVDVVTYLTGVRRVMGRRWYEFRRPGEKVVLARGYTDWVFLDRKGMLPVSIPEEILSAFFPQHSNIPKVDREPFPEPAAPPKDVFICRRGVAWKDIDPMQHLNNAAYLDYAMECAVSLTGAYEWPMSRWLEEGIAFVARRNSLEYLQPAQLEDEIEIHTWLFNVRPATVTRQFDIFREGNSELLARIQTLWVVYDLEKRRPMRVPPAMLEILGPNISRVDR